MARGINKVILIGNLGADPETRYMPSGKAVTNIRIATSEGWKDKQTGDLQERTEWHRIALFDKLAEVAAEYLRKGSQVYIEGSLRTRKWQDKEGKDQYSTEVVAREMQMLGGRGGAGGGGGGSTEGRPERRPAAAPAPPIRTLRRLSGSGGSENDVTGIAGSYLKTSTVEHLFGVKIDVHVFPLLVGLFAQHRERLTLQDRADRGIGRSLISRRAPG